MLVLLGAVCVTGCQLRPAAPHRLLRGSADLNRLVKLNPGWSSVVRIDQASAQLAALGGTPPDLFLSSDGADMLPALDIGRAPESRPALSAISNRLAKAESVQLARLTERQAENRDRQLALDQQEWLRQAEAQHTLAVQTARTSYAEKITHLSVADDAVRVNLKLQIRALQQIVLGWDRSKPPTPILNRSKAELAQKQIALAAISDKIGTALSVARAERDAAIRQADEARNQYVAKLTTREEARLSAQDARVTEEAADRLSKERTALLKEEQSPLIAFAPDGTRLDPVTLPAIDTVGQPQAVSAQRTSAAQAGLRAQRTRLIAYLTDETRSAALDVANRNHWAVTFGPGQTGQKDLTAALAQALRSGAWKM